MHAECTSPRDSFRDGTKHGASVCEVAAGAFLSRRLTEYHHHQNNPLLGRSAMMHRSVLRSHCFARHSKNRSQYRLCCLHVALGSNQKRQILLTISEDKIPGQKKIATHLQLASWTRFHQDQRLEPSLRYRDRAPCPSKRHPLTL